MVFEVLVGLVLCEIDEVFVVVDFVFLSDVDDDEMVVFKDLGLDWFFFFLFFIMLLIWFINCCLILLI